MNNVQADPNAPVCSALELCNMWLLPSSTQSSCGPTAPVSWTSLNCQIHRVCVSVGFESMAATVSREHCSNLEKCLARVPFAESVTTAAGKP